MTDRPHQNGSTTSAADDLNRVREILFGADQRRTNEQLAELRRDFEQQLQSVRADAERERQELRAELEQQLELLRAGKIDRDDLAEMFGNIVSRLGTAATKSTGA
jgi:DNA-binding protein H-NS